mgnify:CR=1 FL=1
METIKKNIYGILVMFSCCDSIMVTRKQFPVIGGAVISILAGDELLLCFGKKKVKAAPGIQMDF